MDGDKSQHETTREAYRRGAQDGGIAERLARYDEHFDRINGSQEKIAQELTELPRLRTELQRMADGIEAQKNTRTALRDAAQGRWSRAEKFFAALVTLMSVISATAAVAAVVVAVRG